MDLRCRLNQVLQVGAGEEVAEVDELAVVLVLDYTLSVHANTLVLSHLTVDEAPAVLASANLLAIDNNVLL